MLGIQILHNIPNAPHIPLIRPTLALAQMFAPVAVTASLSPHVTHFALNPTKVEPVPSGMFSLQRNGLHPTDEGGAVGPADDAQVEHGSEGRLGCTFQQQGHPGMYGG